MSDENAENPQLTDEQTSTIARTMYEPTLRRMNILCSSLIQMTQNGDFALWAPMAVMHQQLGGLKWTSAAHCERFLHLIALTLNRAAEKMSVHALALHAAIEAKTPPPAFAGWTDEDTIAVYDEIDARYPRPAEPAEPPTPAVPQEPTNAEAGPRSTPSVD